VSVGSQHWDEEQGQREVVESALDSVYFERDYDPAVDDYDVTESDQLQEEVQP
jgi:hypothetical protein